jgi:ABC-type transporter Mla maintaining outer membrane lipid asymmetry ATPase subunit MlaF
VTAKTDGAATAGDEPLNGRAAAVSLRELGVVVDGKELLRDVSIEIPANQITLLVGPSGAGKSVLLRLLGGLVDPHDPVIRQTGQIVMHGDRGAATDEETSPQDHGATRRVGIVFQNFALFDQWSPLDNVRFAIDHRGRGFERRTEATAGDRADARCRPGGHFV